MKVKLSVAVTWRCRRSSRELPSAGPVAPHPPDAGPDHAGRQASRDAAWELLRSLPRRQRAVLVLRYYEDLPDAEIATILGCAESTVRSQATRALAALRAVVPAMDREALP